MKQRKYDKKLSLYPLTPDQALSAALRVKPQDLAKQGRADRAKKGMGRRPKK